MAENELNTDMGSEGGEDQQAARLSVGATLREERLRQELSEKEVADKLHITMHYVKAIESDCYEKLPGAVFAKGYIKSYAGILELNEGEILQLYSDISKRQEESKEEEIRQKARKRKDRNKPWLILSAIIFIGGFTGLWLYNKFSTDDASQPGAPLPNTQPQEARTSESLNSQISANSQLVPETDVEDDVVATRSPLDTRGSNSSIPTRYSTVESQLDGISSIPASSAETNASELGSQLLEEAPLQQVISVGEAGNDMLRVSFSGESWIEISDADSNQLYRNIREAGDILEVSGNAPFNILLGDAPFASMTLNGESINVTDNIRIDNSARLTVGL